MSYNRKIDPMMTSGEVARFLNVHVNTVRRWSNVGMINPYRIGPRGDRRFERDDVTNLLKHMHRNLGDVKKAKEDLILSAIH